MPYLAISITEWRPIYAKNQSLPDTSRPTTLTNVFNYTAAFIWALVALLIGLDWLAFFTLAQGLKIVGGLNLVERGSEVCSVSVSLNLPNSGQGRNRCSAPALSWPPDL